MFGEHRGRNFRKVDASEVIGHFIASRYRKLPIFVSTCNGPQISYVSGVQYEQLYSVRTVKSFHEIVDQTVLYVENGILDKFEDDHYIQNYLDQHFKKGHIFRYIAYYERRDLTIDQEIKNCSSAGP